MTEESEKYLCAICGVERSTSDFGNIDPSSGGFSNSRWGLKKSTIWGLIAGYIAIVGGLVLNSAGIVAAGAGIFTSIAATNATVYFGSTRKDYKC